MSRNEVLDVNIVEDEESTLRPSSFDEYVGQTDLKENLKVFVGAAKLRNESLDHVLLYGPPGLGKTTMSMIIANEMEKNIKITTGTNIEKTAKLMPQFRLVFRLIFLSGAEHVKRIPTWHRLFLLKLQKYLNRIC